MGAEAFGAIKAGLEDAIAYAKGEAKRGVAHRVSVPDVDVRELRRKLNLSQGEFAHALRVSPATIRNWEQGRRRPEGPARVLLHLISREPEMVLRTLEDVA